MPDPVTYKELMEMFDRLQGILQTSHVELSKQIQDTKKELGDAINSQQTRIVSLEKEVRDRESNCRQDLIDELETLKKKYTVLANTVEGHDASIKFYKRVAYGSVVTAVGALILFASIILDHLMP